MRNEKVLFKLKYLDSFIYCDIFFLFKKKMHVHCLSAKKIQCTIHLLPLIFFSIFNRKTDMFSLRLRIFIIYTILYNTF